MIPKERFTHYAWFRGVPCYWNDDTNELTGRNLLFDLLLEWVAMPIDSFIQVCCCAVATDYEAGFAIRLTGYISETPTLWQRVKAWWRK